MERKNVSKWLLELPNKLTIGRIAAIPLLLALYPWNIGFLNVFCAALFAVAAITDFFDGYLARKYNNTTRMGSILDPIADKLLITAAIILLTNSQIIPAWMAGLFLCREVAVSGARIAAAERGFSIEVSQLGKWKTAFQDVAIFVLMLNMPEYRLWGITLAWIALGLSYFSAYRYWQGFWELANNSDENNDID